MSKSPQNALLQAIGFALHRWSAVEFDLAILFAHLMGFDTYGKAHAIFGTIINFETRVAICDRMVAMHELSELDQALWLKISARLSKSYKKRHQLAHFSLNRDGSEIRPFLTTDSFRDENHPHLNVQQVRERSKKFLELAETLEWFGRYVVRCRMPLQAAHMPPLEEPPLVAQLRELAARSLEERERRGKDPRD